MKNLKKWGVTFGALSTIIALVSEIHELWTKQGKEEG